MYVHEPEALQVAVPCGGSVLPVTVSVSSFASVSLSSTNALSCVFCFVVSVSSTATGGEFATTLTWTVPTSVPPLPSETM